MEKQYISDKIGDQYKEWGKGDVILIKSPTGSGKSEFIKNQLLKWCESEGKSILLLSNRTLLIQQQRNDIKQNAGTIQSEVVTLGLYQTFTDDIKDFDFVVCDECHYFYEDSSFNRQTDIIYKKIQNYSDGAVILLSATTELIENRLSQKIDRTYELPHALRAYKLYKFTNRKNVHSIIQQIRKDYPSEKIIYFSSSAKKAYETSRCFDDSAFICSQSNSDFGRRINTKQRDQIKTNSSFSCNLLCATTALDNGVNIKDDQVKHIILDVFSSVSTVQCFGRKRLRENELISIYLRDFNNGDISFYRNIARQELESYNDYNTLPKEEFLKKYNKKSTGRILDLADCENGGFSYQVNECIRDLNQYMIQFCTYCIENSGAYFKYVCNKMGVDSDKAIDIYFEIEYENIELVLKKWEGIKLFENEKSQFREDFFLSINGRSLDKRLKGVKTFNSIIEDMGLPYIIEKSTEWSRNSEYRGKAYWIIKTTIGKKNTEI